MISSPSAAAAAATVTVSIAMQRKGIKINDRQESFMRKEKYPRDELFTIQTQCGKENECGLRRLPSWVALSLVMSLFLFVAVIAAESE